MYALNCYFKIIVIAFASSWNEAQTIKNFKKKRHWNFTYYFKIRFLNDPNKHIETNGLHKTLTQSYLAP